MQLIGCNSFIQSDFMKDIKIKYDINREDEYDEQHGRFEVVVT